MKTKEQMGESIEITVRRGDEEKGLPILMKIFVRYPWTFAFKGIGYFRGGGMTEEETNRYEAREAIRSFVYMLERELTEALPHELRMK